MARKAKKQEVSYDQLLQAMIENGHVEDEARGLIALSVDAEPASEDEIIGYRFAVAEVAAGYEQVANWAKWA